MKNHEKILNFLSLFFQTQHWSEMTHQCTGWADDQTQLFRKIGDCVSVSTVCHPGVNTATMWCHCVPLCVTMCHCVPLCATMCHPSAAEPCQLYKKWIMPEPDVGCWILINRPRAFHLLEAIFLLLMDNWEDGQMVGEKQIFLFPSVSGFGLFSTGSSVWMPSSLGLHLLFKVIWSLTPTGPNVQF